MASFALHTRYADDLIFSGDRHLVRASQSIVALVEEIALDEGFKVHELKTRVFTAAQRQTVTGLVVNERTNVPRTDYDRLRAILHHAATRGPDRANREQHADFRSHLQVASRGSVPRTTREPRSCVAPSRQSTGSGACVSARFRPSARHGDGATRRR